MGCVTEAYVMRQTFTQGYEMDSLNSSSFAWLPQVDHFGRLPEYSVLVFDNRGVGNSGAPRGPYS
jgi:hypothetical protein